MKHLLLSTLLLATAGLLHAGPAPDTPNKADMANAPKSPKSETISDIKPQVLQEFMLRDLDNPADLNKASATLRILVASEADLKAALYEIADLKPVEISQESAQCAVCHITAAREKLLKNLSRRAEDIWANAPTVEDRVKRK